MKEFSSQINNSLARDINGVGRKVPSLVFVNVRSDSMLSDLSGVFRSYRLDFELYYVHRCLISHFEKSSAT